MTETAAEAWAIAVDEDEPLSLAELERQAFREHPEIVEAFAALPEHAYAHSQQPSSKVPGWVFVILTLVALIAPMLGVASYGTHDYLDLPPTAPEVYIPMTGICFLITIGCQLLSILVWLKTGAGWSTVVFGYALISAVLGLFGTIGVHNSAAREGAEVGLWGIPSIIALGLGALIALVVLLQYWRAKSQSASEAVDVSDARSRVRALVTALPETEQERIRLDRDAALTVLFERGLISEETERIAKLTELGLLTWIEAFWWHQGKRLD